MGQRTALRTSSWQGLSTRPDAGESRFKTLTPKTALAEIGFDKSWEVHDAHALSPRFR